MSQLGVIVLLPCSQRSVLLEDKAVRKTSCLLHVLHDTVRVVVTFVVSKKLVLQGEREGKGKGKEKEKGNGNGKGKGNRNGNEIKRTGNIK
jgi:hypothetical protein